MADAPVGNGCSRQGELPAQSCDPSPPTTAQGSTLKHMPGRKLMGFIGGGYW